MEATEISPPGPGVKPPIQGQRVRLGKQVVDLGDLIPLYGATFTSDLLDRIARAHRTGHFVHAHKQARALAKFLTHVAHDAAQASGSKSCDALYYCLSHKKTPTRADLEESLKNFFDLLSDIEDVSFTSSRNINSRRHIAEFALRAVREISIDGHWPTIGKVSVNMRTIRHGTPSLGELRRSVGANHPNDRPSSDERMSVIMARSRARLLALRALLASEFEAHWTHFVEGERLLKLPNLPDIETIEEAVEAYRSRNELDWSLLRSIPAVQECFPDDDNTERWEACILRYLADRKHGVLTTGDLQRWENLLQACGGTASIRRRLGACGRALAAAQGIILIDTGFNLQPCSDLRADPVCIQASNGRQILSTITSYKMRAGGKLVPAVLENYEASVTTSTVNGQISALEVINRWKQMTHRYRLRAERQNDNTAEYLWIRPLKREGDGQISARSFVTYWWNKIISENLEHPVLGGLDIKRQTIRPTVIQLRFNDSGLDVASAALVASHTTTRTTVRQYLNRNWFVAEMDELIRDFQRLWEAEILGDRSDRHEQLNVSRAEYERRRMRAAETGLGFSCLDPFSGHQPGSRKGKACDQLEACAGCSLLRFVPSRRALEALVLTERSLAAAEHEFISRNPERWRQCWMPLLALARATMSRLQESHRAVTLAKAEQAVDSQIASGVLVGLRPW